MTCANIIGNFLYHYLGLQGIGPWYGGWSGFFANFGELTIIVGAFAFYKHHKCASCWRPGHHTIAETGQKLCHACCTHAGIAEAKAKHRLKFPDHIAHSPKP